MAWRWSVCGTAEVVWKPRFLWQWPSAHLHFLVSCFSFSSWQYLIDSAVTLVFKKHNGPTPADDNATQIIWKLNTGLQATWDTKLALIWKEDFGPLGYSPVLLLLSSGKMPLTTTVAKFLDTSVCGGSWCLDLSLSPFLVKFTQILESIFLDNPHKAAVLSVGCASFSSTLFPFTQLSVNMLRYSTLWTASFFGNECLWLTLLVKGVNDCLLDNCQISSLPHDCVA